MKKAVTIALAVLMGGAATPALAVTTTFHTTGVTPQGTYTSVTVNTDAGTIVYHFEDGSTLTANPGVDQIWAYYHYYQSRSLQAPGGGRP